MTTPGASRTDRIPAWGAALLLILAAILGSLNLGGFLMNDDEGTYLYGAWRTSLGEVPYRDFTIVQAPLSFYLAAGVFKVFGPTVAAARGMSVFFLLGLAVLIYSAGRRSFGLGRGAALAAAGVLFLNKHVFFLGRSFMPDVPMVFFAAAALAAALRAEDGEAGAKAGRRAAFLSGLLAGLAALAKLNGALVLAGYGLYLLAAAWRAAPRRDILARAGAAAAGFALSFGIPFGLLLAFVPNAYECTVGFHAAKEAVGTGSYVGLVLDRLARFVGNHNYGLVAGALAGLVLKAKAGRRPKLQALFAAAAVLSLVLLPGRFFPRYVVFALVPLALLFGAGLEGLRARRRVRVFAFPLLAVLVLLCLGPTLSPKKVLARDEGTRALAAFIEGRTGPNDHVFGDDPFINFLARRPCPPRLIDVSEAMVTSGRVKFLDIIEACEKLEVKVLFIERGNSAHHLVKLRDFARLEAYLEESYIRAASIKREFLDVDVFLRK